MCLNHREWSLTFFDYIWDDTGSRRWICLNPAAHPAPFQPKHQVLWPAELHMPVTASSYAQRCIAMNPQGLGWSWMLLKIPRQLKIDGDGRRWYQSPRLGIRPEVWSLVNPDLTTNCKSFTKESCRGLLQQFRLLWPCRWMLLNDWLTQLRVFFLTLQLQIYGLWKPVPWPRNPLALLDCTVWANHLQFRCRFFVAQIRLAAWSSEKPSTIVSCEFGMSPLWRPQACMVHSLAALPTTAESPHQKRGSYYDVQGKSWRSCTFADSTYKIPISKHRIIIHGTESWTWTLHRSLWGGPFIEKGGNRMRIDQVTWMQFGWAWKSR